MKNHGKTHTGQDGKERHEVKDEKPAAPHGHAHEKGEKHVGQDQAEKAKPAEKSGAEAMAAKMAALQESHIRLLADFDNYRKRSVKEKEAAARLVRESMLMEFLPVIDNVELGINAALAHKVDKVFVDGYRMIASQLSASLAKFGLKPQDALGAPFDANVHEAIQQAPSEQYPAGTVMTVVRKGYLSGDVVLRPAQVIVSTGPLLPPASTVPALPVQGVEDAGKPAEQPAAAPREKNNGA